MFPIEYCNKKKVYHTAWITYLLVYMSITNKTVARPIIFMVVVLFSPNYILYLEGVDVDQHIKNGVY